MKTATIADTKAQLSALIAEVKAGGEIVITRRGKPVARLVVEPRSTPFDWSDLREGGAAAPESGGLSVAEMRLSRRKPSRAAALPAAASGRAGRAVG